MSNLGQALTAVVGGVIGYLVGGPSGALYGFEAGLLAGSLAFPVKPPAQFGPRLSDGQTTTATVGDPVNFGYGFFAVSGTVIYLGKCVEHSTTTSSSGKGAPTQSQTTYSYTQSIAISLCEGVLGSLRRVWENGELVYDARPRQDSETTAVFNNRLAANEAYFATFVLYLGTEDQVADPTMEADKGVGNVPAFRALAYIMYPDRKLRDDQGQRHPTFKFELHVPLAGYESDDVPADLQHIITLICARCGYDTATQIDASSMADVTVGGYAVQAVMTGRDALTPLRSVGLFDCVESATKLKFVKRGAAPLRTLLDTDIGVYDMSSSNEDPDAAIAVTEQQDVELPMRVRVSYLSTDLDYEVGQQLSPARFDTDAVNTVDAQLAVCISDTQALQIAEILWADAWQARDTYTTAVDQSNADIEPSDVLIVPMLGSNFRMRVDSVNDASQIMRKLTLISDDDGAYVSSAVAAPSSRPPQTLSVSSASVLTLLDIPALQDADDDAGFYAVARGDGTGSRWTGCVVYKSMDGDTFTQKATISGSPPLATLHANLGAGITDTWDDENYIDVAMIKGEFSSRDDDAVLAGANAIAVGAHGRWEIVQFGVATDMSDSAGPATRLSHLLRGRRGTEWAVGTGVFGDMVVGVSMGNLFRIPLQVSEIGVAETYKAVTIGSAYATGTDQVFTGRGVALKPFAPASISAHFSGSDLVLSWVRCDRFGQVLTSGVETLMSEATESYQIDVLMGSPATVVRTLASTTPTVTYHAADIVTDFGSPPAHFHVRAYQMSATVGRGYPLEGTVP